MRRAPTYRRRPLAMPIQAQTGSMEEEDRNLAAQLQMQEMERLAAQNQELRQQTQAARRHTPPPPIAQPSNSGQQRATPSTSSSRNRRRLNDLPVRPVSEVAEDLRSSICWSTAVNFLLGIFLLTLLSEDVALLAIGAVLLLASVSFAWLSARRSSTRSATCHTLFAAATTLYKSLAVPFSTKNFLAASTAIAVSLPAAHLTSLSVRWLFLLR